MSDRDDVAHIQGQENLKGPNAEAPDAPDAPDPADAAPAAELAPPADPQAAAPREWTHLLGAGGQNIHKHAIPLKMNAGRLT